MSEGERGQYSQSTQYSSYNILQVAVYIVGMLIVSE